MCRITFELNPSSRLQKYSISSKPTIKWGCLEINEICDFNCVYCGFKSVVNSHNHSMSLENYKKIVDKLQSFGIEQLSIVGGEPLLYKDIIKAIRYAKASGLTVHLCSNAYYLTQKQVSQLSRANLDQIQINIDHIEPSIHDKIRNKEGSFDRAITAINHLTAVNIPVVIATTYLKQNQDKILKILELSIELNADAYRIWSMIPMGNMIDIYHKYCGDITKYKEIVSYISHNSDKYGIKKIRVVDPLLISMKDELPSIIDYSGCPAGKYFISVSSYGDLYPCSGSRNEPIGNVLNTNLSSIYSHNDFIKFNTNLSSFCNECTHVEHCKGGCKTMRYTLFNNYNGPDPRCWYGSPKTG